MFGRRLGLRSILVSLRTCLQPNSHASIADSNDYTRREKPDVRTSLLESSGSGFTTWGAFFASLGDVCQPVEVVRGGM